MINSVTNSNLLSLLEKVAAFTEKRHEVIAGNIANIDTPDYRMRDLPVEEFQVALQNAISAGRPSQQQSSLWPGMVEFPANDSPNIESYFSESLYTPREAPAENLTFHDGGNRSIEHQVSSMTKNMMMQRFAVELMSAQMQMLETVIRERV